ncbi:MAG: LacI family DNA-binding transcriptional regulator [Pseudomonadales bacterium]
MKVTIKDVAKAAGVSFKTVSRVINNEPTVSAPLQEKVRTAIKALDYRPNLSARQLRGAPASIGFIYDNPNSNYVIDLQHGILEECKDKGYELVIHPCDSTSSVIVSELSQLVSDGRVAGLLLTPPLSEDAAVVRALLDAGIKFARIVSGAEAPDKFTPAVFVDDHYAAQKICQHLIQLGHTRIAFLSGDPEHKSSGERLAGYESALQDSGLAIDARLIVDGKFEFESGVQRSLRLLEQPDRPTAIFAANDEIAAGALFAARMLDIVVPQDLSVAGFEDSPFSRQTWPRLTTARQPNKTIARQAAALLIAAMHPATKSDVEAEDDVQQGFRPKLIIRDSTATAPTVA